MFEFFKSVGKVPEKMPDESEVLGGDTTLEEEEMLSNIQIAHDERAELSDVKEAMDEKNKYSNTPKVDPELN